MYVERTTTSGHLQVGAYGHWLEYRNLDVRGEREQSWECMASTDRQVCYHVLQGNRVVYLCS